MKDLHILTLDPQKIMDFIAAQGGFILRREIARAFNIKGEHKRALKNVLQELEQQEKIVRRGKSYQVSLESSLATAKVVDIDQAGRISATLVDPLASKTLVSIHLEGSPTLLSRLSVGDRAIVKVARGNEDNLVGTVIRLLAVQSTQVFGLVEETSRNKYVLQPLDRKAHDPYPLDLNGMKSIVNGTFIEAYLEKTSGSTLIAKAVTQLKTPDEFNQQFSLLAAYKYDLPQQFNSAAVLLAEKSKLPGLKGRRDLRHLALVTIDDGDARDHDDAVYAEPIKESSNWRLVVAIADVSHFVKIHDALDQEALARSNSVYFPDQVIPMLPERLSNDLCSLKPNVDRPCLVADMVVNSQGHLKDYNFYSAMIRSHAKLTYTGVQQVLDNNIPNGTSLPKTVTPKNIHDLYHVYQLLKTARSKRGTLDLDIPEQKIVLDDKGNIKAVIPRKRLQAHELIEEMMVLANVAAAQYLSSQPVPPLYRIHDQPRQERLEDLRGFLESTPISLPKGQVLKPINFMHILHKAKDLAEGPAIHELVLRSQSRAQYSPENIGHFGLNLPQYCHFTSPIRRYADLIVHRAIKAKIENEKTFYPYTYAQLESIGEEISEKERRTSKAERETIERYVARYLEPHIGQPLQVRISGLTDFAVFLTHVDTGADGILPLRNILGDYFTYYPKEQKIKGRRSQITFKLGDQFLAELARTNWLTGSLIFSLTIHQKEELNSHHAPFNRARLKTVTPRQRTKFKGRKSKHP